MPEHFSISLKPLIQTVPLSEYFSNFCFHLGLEARWYDKFCAYQPFTHPEPTTISILLEKHLPKHPLLS